MIVDASPISDNAPWPQLAAKWLARSGERQQPRELDAAKLKPTGPRCGRAPGHRSSPASEPDKPLAGRPAKRSRAFRPSGGPSRLP